MATRISIEVWSDVEYEQLTAEIYVDGEFFGLVSEERGPTLFDVEVHSRQSGLPWRLTLEELRTAVDQAASRLLRMRRRAQDEEGGNTA